MTHEHSHGNSGATGNLRTAFFLNLFFTIIEIFGGIYTNSIAILSDALHDAGDCLALGVSWRLQVLSKRGPSKTLTYGFQRFSPLAALLMGAVLSVGALIIIYKAIPRLSAPEPVEASGMILLAILGIAVNGFAAWKASRGSSLNESIVSWHLLEDTLGWIAVLIGSIVMKIWDVPIIDPILSIAISVFILVNVVKNILKVIKVFVQAIPDGFNSVSFREKVLNIPEVRDLHATHCWSLDGESHVLTTHLVLNAETPRATLVDVKTRVSKILADMHVKNITIEIELEGEPCLSKCIGVSIG